MSDEDLLAQVRRSVLPAMTKQGPVVAWNVDDTKPRIALEQIRQAVDKEVPGDLALADAGYGSMASFWPG